MSFLRSIRSVVRFRKFELNRTNRLLRKVANVDDLRSLAKRRLPAGVFDYIDGGAEDEITLRNSCKAYKQALEKYYPGESLPIYASKANSSIFMSNLVSSEGLGLDAVSEGELLTALKGGVPNEKIVFHGNNKSDKELVFAVKNNIKVIVDNDYDLERLDEISNSLNRELDIMIRFTPGIECHTHEYIRTGHLDSKFGFDPDELETVLIKLKSFICKEFNLHKESTTRHF